MKERGAVKTLFSNTAINWLLDDSFWYETYGQTN